MKQIMDDIGVKSHRSLKNLARTGTNGGWCQTNLRIFNSITDLQRMKLKESVIFLGVQIEFKLPCTHINKLYESTASSVYTIEDVVVELLLSVYDAFIESKISYAINVDVINTPLD